MQSYLAAEPFSFPASSSILLNTAFFSSFVAPTNSFTNVSSDSTIPAYCHGYKGKLKGKDKIML